MRRLLLSMALAIGLAGCDDGLSGPGELTAVVETPGPALGGAVLELSGKGVTGFASSGSTQVFHAATDQADTYRLVLIAPTAGQLQFRVAVQDRGGKRPSASVVSLVTEANTSLPATADYQVRFSRR